MTFGHPPLLPFFPRESLWASLVDCLAMLVPRFVMFSLKSRVFPSRRTLCTVHTAQVDPSMISMGRAIGDRERDAGGDAFPCPPPPLHARVRLSPTDAEAWKGSLGCYRAVEFAQSSPYLT